MSLGGDFVTRGGGNWRATARPLPHTLTDSQTASRKAGVSCRPSPGDVLFLGRVESVPTSSVFRQRLTPSHGNPWNHPVVVISVNASAETVTWLPMTSVDIFERAKDPLWAMRYVPIHHPRYLTPRMRSEPSTTPFVEHPTASQPILLLEGEQVMKKPTCVNVEEAFDIEWAYLQPCPGPSKRLTRASVKDLLQVKADYVRPEVMRAQSKARSDSMEIGCLHQRLPTPPPESPVSVPVWSAPRSPSRSPSSRPMCWDSGMMLSPPSSPERATAVPAVSVLKGAYVPPHRRGGAQVQSRGWYFRTGQCDADALSAPLAPSVSPASSTISRLTHTAIIDQEPRQYRAPRSHCVNIPAIL